MENNKIEKTFVDIKIVPNLGQDILDEIKALPQQGKFYKTLEYNVDGCKVRVSITKPRPVSEETPVSPGF